MHKIASPQDLQVELTRLIAYAESPHPSRTKLASDLQSLAVRVASRNGEGEVIESKHWIHTDTGAKASLYGALPWSGAPGDRKEDWKVDTVGWTIRWDNGTVGVGRKPFHSKQEAEEWLLQHPHAPRFGD